MRYFRDEKATTVLNRYCGIAYDEAINMFNFNGCNRVLAWVDHLVKGSVPVADRAKALRYHLRTSDGYPTGTAHSSIDSYLTSESFLAVESTRRRQVWRECLNSIRYILRYVHSDKSFQAEKSFVYVMDRERLFTYLPRKTIEEFPKTVTVLDIEKLYKEGVRKHWLTLYSHVTPEIDCKLIEGNAPVALPYPTPGFASMVRDLAPSAEFLEP